MSVDRDVHVAKESQLIRKGRDTARELAKEKEIETPGLLYGEETETISTLGVYKCLTKNTRFYTIFVTFFFSTPSGDFRTFSSPFLSVQVFTIVGSSCTGETR